MALSGADASQSALLNMEMTAEALVPTVFQQVAIAIASDPDKQSLLRRTFTIALTNGVGTLDDVILTQFMHDSTLNDPDDDTIIHDMSFVPRWSDFKEAKDYEPRLGYYTCKGDDQLHYIRPTDTVETKTGNVEITVSSIPEIPATYTDPLVVPAECLSDLQAAMANALRAKMVVSV